MINMLDYTQSFQDFATGVKPSDLALYAGAGLVLWVLFKDKLSPVQKLVGNLLETVKNKTSLPVTLAPTKPVVVNKEDVFFNLVVSWKQTRDLASQCGCDEAVKVADQMFPYLSPVVCTKEQV